MITLESWLLERLTTEKRIGQLVSLSKISRSQSPNDLHYESDKVRTEMIRAKLKGLQERGLVYRSAAFYGKVRG